MTGALERGFKSRAEELSLEIRTTLGLSAYDRLDPTHLAGHLGIMVVSLPELSRWGASASSIQRFLDSAPGDLSALTITSGEARLIVENPRHSSRRRSSSLTHELSHILLKHDPGPAFGLGGCRQWSQKDEEEADWLAGALLVPRPAALRYARRGISVWVAANELGVSFDLMKWRMNQTGAVAQARREQLMRATRLVSTRGRPS